MSPNPELAPQLKQLRLSGILDSLEARNRQAIESELAYTDFLAMLIGDEVVRRRPAETFHAAKTKQTIASVCDISEARILMPYDFQSTVGRAHR